MKDKKDEKTREVKCECKELARAILEQQKYNQLSPDTIKDLKRIADDKR